MLYQRRLAHDIAAVAPTCHALDDAAKIALKWRPFSGEVVTLAGHKHRVECVAALHDGRVITGSVFTIKVWRDGACVRTIQAETSNSGVAVLPDGPRFVSVSRGGAARLWTLDGALEHAFEVGSQLRCVAALPDGVHFVVGLWSPYEVRLYHVDGTLVHTFKGHTDEVDAVAVTPDGQHIISGGGGYNERSVRVWLLDGTLKNNFQLHTGWVEALVALPDNQHALSGSYDKTVKLFNVDDGAVLRTFTHAHPVWCLALLPDGLRFVSGAADNTARIVYHGLAPQA